MVKWLKSVGLGVEELVSSFICWNISEAYYIEDRWNIYKHFMSHSTVWNIFSSSSPSEIFNQTKVTEIRARLLSPSQKYVTSVFDFSNTCSPDKSQFAIYRSIRQHSHHTTRRIFLFSKIAHSRYDVELIFISFSFLSITVAQPFQNILLSLTSGFTYTHKHTLPHPRAVSMRLFLNDFAYIYTYMAIARCLGACRYRDYINIYKCNSGRITVR